MIQGPSFCQPETEWTKSIYFGDINVSNNPGIYFNNLIENKKRLLTVFSSAIFFVLKNSYLFCIHCTFLFYYYELSLSFRSWLCPFRPLCFFFVFFVPFILLSSLTSLFSRFPPLFPNFHISPLLHILPFSPLFPVTPIFPYFSNSSYIAYIAYFSYFPFVPFFPYFPFSPIFLIFPFYPLYLLFTRILQVVTYTA